MKKGRFREAGKVYVDPDESNYSIEGTDVIEVLEGLWRLEFEQGNRG